MFRYTIGMEGSPPSEGRDTLVKGKSPSIFGTALGIGATSMSSTLITEHNIFPFFFFPPGHAWRHVEAPGPGIKQTQATAVTMPDP